jgi:O-antigen/teichoic acid export membrane protein
VTLSKQGALALGWTYIGIVVKAIGQVGIQIALARILGPQAFGEYSILLVLVTLGWLVADFGLSAAIVQKSELSDADISFVFWVVLTLSVAIMLVIIALATQISDFFSTPGLQDKISIVALAIALQAISNISMSLLRRDMKMARYQAIQQGSYLAGFGGVSIIAAINGLGAWALVLGYLSQVIITLVAGYLVRPYKLMLNLAGDIKMVAFGVNVLATNMANWMVENVDRMLVAKYWGAGALANYTVPMNLTRAPVSMIVGALQTVVFTVSSRMQDQPGKTVLPYGIIVKVLSLLLMPSATVVALNSNFIIDLMYGAQWAQAAQYMAPFVMATPFMAASAITGSLLWGLGLVQKELRAQVIIGFVLLVAILALAHFGFSLQYVAWLVPVTYLARYIMLARAYGQAVGVRPLSLFGKMGGAILLSAMIFLMGLSLGYLGFNEGGVRLAAEAVVAFGVTLIYARFAFDDAERSGIEALAEEVKIMKIIARILLWKPSLPRGI